MNHIHVCVGSLNPTKFNAAKNAYSLYFENISFYNCDADSQVSDQPISLDEIIKGATNRAKFALGWLRTEKMQDRNIFGVGIESGLVPISHANTNYMDFQFCVILDEYDEKSIGSGIGFEYPPRVIEELILKENTEIGEIMGKISGNSDLKKEGGAISFLSQSKINRTEILTQSVICALLPRINNELYQKRS